MDYLVKPLVPVILRAKVAGFVELFQKTEQIQRQAEQLRQLERREFERKLAEENARLRDSEERFARFMQHLPGLAWIKDSQGRYVYANDAAERAFRTPREQLYGKTDEEVFPPETAAQFRENDRRALASGAGVQVVETLEHEDGVAPPLARQQVPHPRPGRRGGAGRRDGHRHHRPDAGRGGAAGGRPPQGRVPGHAGPRTAQPPGPDPQRPAL